MINRFKPEGEEREWRSVSMVIQLDAELNYLLEKMCGKEFTKIPGKTCDGTKMPKKDLVMKFIREGLNSL